MKQKEGSSTKLHIAKVAEQLFSQKGYAATSMEDITLASGSSKGSIYYHFKSKDKLFLFIVETAANEWKEEWKRIEANCKSNTEKLYAISEHYVNDFQNPIFKASEEFTNSQVVDADTTSQILTIVRNQYYETYEKIFKDGIATGEFINDNPKEMMYMLFSLHNGLGVAYYEMDFEQLKNLYKKAIDLLLNGLAAK